MNIFYSNFRGRNSNVEKFMVGLSEILNRNIGVHRGETLFVASEFHVRGIKQFSRKLLHSGGHTVNTVTAITSFNPVRRGPQGLHQNFDAFDLYTRQLL